MEGIEHRYYESRKGVDRWPPLTKIPLTKVRAWGSEYEDVSKNNKSRNSGSYREEVPVNTDITHI